MLTSSVIHLLFQKFLAAGIFATLMKRGNIVPVHKDNDQRIVSNYRLVSLRPIYSKKVEKLIFSEFLQFLRTKICYLNINLVFVLAIHIFINYLQSPMISFQFLTRIQHWRQALCSLIYLKRWIELGTMDFYLN